MKVCYRCGESKESNFTDKIKAREWFVKVNERTMEYWDMCDDCCSNEEPNQPLSSVDSTSFENQKGF